MTFKKKKSRCIAETDGVIQSVYFNGADWPGKVTVAYTVNGNRFEVKERVRARNEAIKLGPFAIGQRRVPIMGSLIVGSAVRVAYDPNNPAIAYLPDNRK